MSSEETCTTQPVICAEERKRIVELIQSEVVPALGCTEPIAVALCVARATEALGERPPGKVTVQLSANVLKNAMGVGVPGTGGMVGLPIAVALGAICGKSELKLEVLRGVTPDAVAEGRRLIDEKRIVIALKADIEDTDAIEKLFIQADVTTADGCHRARAIIAGGHTSFKLVSRDDIVIFDQRSSVTAGDPTAASTPTVSLTMRKVFDFATTSPVDELRFILEARKLNKAAAETALQGDYGHNCGKTMRCQKERQLMGDSTFARILCYTSAACDARMAGAMVAVMSNSGSGNQGITATNPIVVYGEDTHATEEQMIRALTLSHLTVIYIKQSLGRLSALCGCVAAATGSSVGITLLMGGGFVEVCSAAKNMIANLTGMICDGAKPSCSMKIMSGVSTAVLSAMLSMEHRCVTAVEGIIEDDVDRCIANLTRIGRDGMNETDRLVLTIMTAKDHSC